MDERLGATPGLEHLPPTTMTPDPAWPDSRAGTGVLDDPKILQILSTEHWSLLSARSLVYNEAFSRAGMFLTFVSASLVALALAANAMAFSSEFLLLATGLLALDLAIGLGTFGRILDVTLDDLRAIHGMNRIRNAYSQIAPPAMPFFVTSIYDDAAGVMATYGEPAHARPTVAAFLHGMTTTDNMIGTINAVLAGAVAGLVVVIAHGPAIVATAAAVVAVVVLFLAESRYALRSIRRFEVSLETRFPTPR